jgi:hypothetical protein
MVSEKYLTELNKSRTSRSRASQSGPRRTGYGGSGTPHASRVRKGGKKTGIRIVNLGAPTDNDSATGPTGVYCYFPRSFLGSRAAACGCGHWAAGRRPWVCVVAAARWRRARISACQPRRARVQGRPAGGPCQCHARIAPWLFSTSRCRKAVNPFPFCPATSIFRSAQVRYEQSISHLPCESQARCRHGVLGFQKIVPGEDELNV